ncbi:MAG: class I SAM-dependent methyltransferase [Deltaproteobacteria bacterium]
MRTDIDALKVIDLNRKFHDEVEAEQYDTRMGVDYSSEGRERLVGELERVLGGPIEPGTLALDLGSGTGKLAIILSLLGRHERVVAVDVSERMLAQAERSAARLGCRVETRVSDMAVLPFEDRSVDLVVGSAFLHHLPDPVALMKEVRRVLRPGGRFVFVGEPSRTGHVMAETLKAPWVALVRTLRVLRGRPARGWEHDHIDVHTFTTSDMRRMSEGFSDVRFVAEGFADHAVEQGFLVLVRRVVGGNRVADAVLDGIRNALLFLDHRFFDRVLPPGMLACVKLSGARPLDG